MSSKESLYFSELFRLKDPKNVGFEHIHSGSARPEVRLVNIIKFSRGVAVIFLKFGL